MTSLTEYPETITLDITQEDINKGSRGDCELCPAALAAARLFLGHTVTVTTNHLYVHIFDYDDFFFVAYTNPDSKLRQFTNDFDERKIVDPTTIVMAKSAALDNLGVHETWTWL